MIDVDYPKLLNLFRDHLDPKRSESASFLIWYLEHYYRLDTLEAVDSVSDQRGDKGVDGIFVNENDQTITVFQSKISQSSNSTIGDAALRNFSGTLKQFANADAVRSLLASAGDAQVGALVRRLDLTNKVGKYELRGEFLTNIDLDRNGEAFLQVTPEIAFVGKSKLVSTYISDQRDLPIRSPASFDIIGFAATEYVVDEDRKAVIAPVKATELVKLDGISNQKLFDFNIRGPLGQTTVNKDIVATIRDTKRHKMFPLFHNEITVITGHLAIDMTAGSLTINEYYVVNGCQSLTALYHNRDFLTDDLRVLVKFIFMNPGSGDTKMITQFSNNQNGVRPRDFKSNTQIQIRLQNKFKKYYKEEYTFEIKRGEVDGQGTRISNEDSGLYLMAFDLGEPWATHRKYMVFEDKHADLFGRPEVTADRIVLCQVIAEAVTQYLAKLENQLFAKYALTKYMCVYIIRQILNKDGLC